MAWYWIVLICIGYLLMMLVTAVIVRLLDITYEDGLVLFISTLWPISWVVGPIVFIFVAIDGISEVIVKRIEHKQEERQRQKQ